MSRGLGRIERAIFNRIQGERHRYFAPRVYYAEDFATAIYQSGPVTRAQRVAILRAMHSLACKFPDQIGVSGGEGRDPLRIYLLVDGLAPGKILSEDESLSDDEAIAEFEIRLRRWHKYGNQ